jgi:hypothetical protein
MTAPFNEFGPFVVGEICRIVRCDKFPELIGFDLVIETPLQEWITGRGVRYLGYGTDFYYKGVRVCPKEEYLRRRKPPALDTGERLIATLIRETLDKAPQRQGIPA